LGPIESNVANIATKINYFVSASGQFSAIIMFSLLRYLLIFHSTYFDLIDEKSLVWSIRGCVIFLTCITFSVDLSMNKGGGLFYNMLRNQPTATRYILLGILQLCFCKQD
jgi:hypothetical protein